MYSTSISFSFDAFMRLIAEFHRLTVRSEFLSLIICDREVEEAIERMQLVVPE